MNRRDFLRTSSTAAALLAAKGLRGLDLDEMEAQIAEYKKPVFHLHSFFSSPVKIESNELLQAYGHSTFCGRVRPTARRG